MPAQDNPDHLSHDDVMRIIAAMADHDPIIVGGQSVNLWAAFYSRREPALLELGPFTSADIDIFSNRAAAESLASSLTDAKLKLAGMDDFASPNAATVVGRLGERTILVDFMAKIIGVDDSSISGHHVAIAGRVPGTDHDLKLLLMSPLDCVRSRLANINDLHRTDEIAVRQAMVSIRILTLYIDDLLSFGEIRYVMDILTDFQFVIRDMHIGKTSHRRFGDRLDLLRIPIHFLDDDRLDRRWRDLTLRKFVDRLRERIARNEAKTERLAQRVGPGSRTENTTQEP